MASKNTIIGIEASRDLGNTVIGINGKRIQGQAVKPISNNTIDNNVEDHGGDNISLGDTTRNPKRRTVVSGLSSNNIEFFPKVREQPNNIRSYSILSENLKGTSMIQGIICFSQIKKDKIKRVSLDIRQLHTQKNFEDGSASASTRTKAM
jgi:hypothetical protein